MSKRCIDCNKLIKNLNAKRCKKCSNKYKAQNQFKYKNILTLEILNLNYIKQEKSLYKIAKQFNLHHEIIRRYLKLYGISRRTIKQANKNINKNFLILSM